MLNYDFKDVTALGTEGHSDAHFMRALRDGVRHNAVNSDGRENKSHACKDAEQQHLRAPLSDRFHNQLLHRADIVHRLVFVDHLDFLSNRGSHGRRIRGSARDQIDEAPAALHVRKIHFRLRLSIERRMANIFHNADDFNRPRPIIAHAKPLTDRFLPTHELANEAFIEDRHRNRIAAVVFVEIPTFYKRHTDGAEVVRTDLSMACRDRFAGCRRWETVD